MAILPIEISDQNNNIFSEVGALKRVIVHRPDRGIEMVTPSNAESLLYDDIVFLPQMKWQHKNFHRILSAFIGANNVIEFQDLLCELMDHEKSKKDLVNLVTSFEGLSPQIAEKLNRLKAKSLAKAMITGRAQGVEQPIFSPLPNFIFTRDIGAVVHGYLLTCLADKSPRKRESILAWFVFHHHPMFRSFQEENEFIDFNVDSGTSACRLWLQQAVLNP